MHFEQEQAEVAEKSQLVAATLCSTLLLLLPPVEDTHEHEN